MKTHLFNRWPAYGLLFLSMMQCKSPEENKPSAIQQRADQYLHQYNQDYQRLNTAANEKSWNLNTHIVDGDTITQREFRRSE